LGHSVLADRIATGPALGAPVPDAADEADLVLLELHPGAAAVPQAAPGQGAHGRRRW
jgi:hypothetical protein